MSTAEASTAPVQTAAPGTPGSEATPLNVSAKSMVSDAFKAAPAAPPVAPAKTEAVAPATEAAPPPVAAKKDSILKTKEAAPVAKTEAAAPQDFPEDKIAIPANASPEAVKNFAAYKASMKEILTAERARVAAAEAKLKVTTTAAPADAAEVERIRAEHKALSDRMAILDLQNHPDFARQYVEPRKKELATVTEVLAYNGKEGVEVAGLLTKPMKEFNAEASKLTEGMNAADAGTVMQSLRRARELQLGEQNALSQSAQLRDGIAAKEAAKQKAAFEAVATEAGEVFNQREITDTMSAEEKTAAQAYNQSVAGLRAKAEARAFGRLSERDVADMAFKTAAFDHVVSHALPTLERHIESQNSVIADLRTQLEAVKGARNPGSVSADSRPGTGQAPTTRQLVGEAFKGRL